MENEYPKKARLNNQLEITLRPIVKDDFDLLLAFLRGLPEEDRMFLRSDITRIDELKRLFEGLTPDHIYGLMAICDGKIIGDATLRRPSTGWSRHVGELGCVVAPEFRHLGVGTILLRSLIDHALSTGIDKLEVRLMATQVAAIRAFDTLGFKREAVLRAHAQDVRGHKQNLLIMTSDVAELWQKMQDVIEETDFQGQ